MSLYRKIKFESSFSFSGNDQSPVSLHVALEDIPKPFTARLDPLQNSGLVHFRDMAIPGLPKLFNGPGLVKGQAKGLSKGRNLSEVLGMSPLGGFWGGF